jgi:hypothetical protein
MSIEPGVMCAFCGRLRVPTTEHVLARWVSRRIPDYDRVARVMLRHRRGNEPTIRDVCVECNGGVLSQLDENAMRWWDASEAATKPVLVGSHRDLARWIGKFIFNTQRVEFREQGALSSPTVTEQFKGWIMGREEAGNRIAAWVALFPEDHAGGQHLAIAGPAETADGPVWQVGLHRFYFCVAWDPDSTTGFAENMAVASCASMPAARLDLVGGSGALEIPVLRIADEVYAALYRGVEEVLGEE